MTNQQFYVKFNGSEIAARNIRFRRILNTKDEFSFTIANPQGTEFNVWRAYLNDPTKKGTVEIWERLSNGLQLGGIIQKVVDGNPITVQGVGWMGALDMLPLDVQRTTFTHAIGKVAVTPSGTTLAVVRDDNGDFGWAADWWNGTEAPSGTTLNPPYFLQVTDNTEDDTEELLADSVSTTGGDISGDETDLEDADATYWETERNGVGYIISTVNFDAVAHAIDKDALLTKIRIKCKGQVDIITGPPQEVYGYWSPDGTTPAQPLFFLYWSDSFSNGVFDVDTEFEIGADMGEYWFTKGAAFWEGGSILIVMRSQAGSTSGSSRLKWDQCKVELDYMTTSFDPVDLEITDTTVVDATKNHYGLVCGATDFSTLNINKNDSIAIGTNIKTALNQVITGLPAAYVTRIVYVIDDTLDFGVYENYEGITGFALLLDLCEKFNLRFRLVYYNSTATGSIVYCYIGEHGSEDSGETLTEFKIRNPIYANDNRYGSVKVYWKHGEVIRTTTDTTNEKQLPIIRRDILTQAEAEKLADDKATYYGTERLDYTLEWNHYMAPPLGAWQICPGLLYDFWIKGAPNIPLLNSVRSATDNAGYNGITLTIDYYTYAGVLSQRVATLTATSQSVPVDFSSACDNWYFPIAATLSGATPGDVTVYDSAGNLWITVHGATRLTATADDMKSHGIRAVDQECRMSEMFQDGALGQFKVVASFGLGSTEGMEYLYNSLAKLDKRITKLQNGDRYDDRQMIRNDGTVGMREHLRFANNKGIASMDTSDVPVTILQLSQTGYTTVTSPSDIKLVSATDKTARVIPSVWDDLITPLTTGKLPGANYPDWATFTTNTSAYKFGIDEYIDLPSTELVHGWEEATTIKPHVHIVLSAATAQEEKVQFTLYYSWGDVSEVMGAEASVSGEYTVPNGTADKTHLLVTLSNIAGTNMKIGSILNCRLKRVAKSAGGNELTAEPFVLSFGIHIEKDTVGSRTVTAK